MFLVYSLSWITSSIPLSMAEGLEGSWMMRTSYQKPAGLLSSHRSSYLLMTYLTLFPTSVNMRFVGIWISCEPARCTWFLVFHIFIVLNRYINSVTVCTLPRSTRVTRILDWQVTPIALECAQGSLTSFVTVFDRILVPNRVDEWTSFLQRTKSEPHMQSTG